MVLMRSAYCLFLRFEVKGFREYLWREVKSSRREDRVQSTRYPRVSYTTFSARLGQTTSATADCSPCVQGSVSRPRRGKENLVSRKGLAASRTYSLILPYYASTLPQCVPTPQDHFPITRASCCPFVTRSLERCHAFVPWVSLESCNA